MLEISQVEPALTIAFTQNKMELLSISLKKNSLEKTISKILHSSQALFLSLYYSSMLLNCLKSAKLVRCYDQANHASITISSHLSNGPHGWICSL